MDDTDLLTFAQEAIFRVSQIAVTLGQERRLQLCGRLGTELFIVSESLKAVEDDESVRKSVLKLLRDVERVCSVSPPRRASAPYPCMLDLANAARGSLLYVQTENNIRRSLDLNSRGKGSLVEGAIPHFKKVTRKFGVKAPITEDIESGPKATPDEYATKANKLVYELLNKHVKCMCCDDEGTPLGHKHVAKLLLKTTQASTPEDEAEFEMLFSLTSDLKEQVSHWENPEACTWQDIQVLVPRRTKVKFEEEPQESIKKMIKEVENGDFCELVSKQAHSRVSLTIENGKLFKNSPQQLKQIVENEPGISLSDLLSRYGRHCLSWEMRIVLGYILALSVWQFYESDWVNTRWTSDTIHFVPGVSPDNSRGTQSGIFAWKPYFSVRFGEKDPDFGDRCTVGSEEIHQYPRIRALGVMLVEIGVGMSLESIVPDGREVAKRNWIWQKAKEHADSRLPWPGCRIPAYRTAVKNCLDPRTFELPLSAKAQTKMATGQTQSVASSATISNGVEGVSRTFGDPEDWPGKTTRQAMVIDGSTVEETDTIGRRRKLLFEKVVFPLQELVRVTGWMEDLSAIGPVEMPHVMHPAIVEPEPAAPKKSSPRSAIRESEEWLSHIHHLNNEVVSVHHEQAVRRSGSIKIAVIDTGYDENVPFFHLPHHRRRIRGWKDWIKDSRDAVDIVGHGTHVLSVIMKVAPEADIYVARVAEDENGLGNTSEEIVAKAIEWAWSEWKVDIISMSFGYSKHQPEIERAIYRGVQQRRSKILYFAAAANFGAREAEMCPARLAPVISMRGTNARGFFQDFNPPPKDEEGVVYGTLGVDVLGASIRLDSGMEPKSGSSVATAVAAGMAAVLLDYAAWKNPQEEGPGILSKLKTQQGMLAMFKYLSGSSMHDKHRHVSLQKLCRAREPTRWAIVQAALAEVE